MPEGDLEDKGQTPDGLTASDSFISNVNLSRCMGNRCSAVAVEADSLVAEIKLCDLIPPQGFNGQRDASGLSTPHLLCFTCVPLN